MGQPLSPGTCLLLCLLTQLTAAASGDGVCGTGWVVALDGGCWGWCHFPGVFGDPVTSLWDTSKGKKLEGKSSWPPQGGLRPQALNGFVSAPTKVGTIPVPQAPLPPHPLTVTWDSRVSIAAASCGCPDVAHSLWRDNAWTCHPLCREAPRTSLPNCASVSTPADCLWAMWGLPKPRLIPKRAPGPSKTSMNRAQSS